jgi:hypothetical protein
LMYLVQLRIAIEPRRSPVDLAALVHAHEVTA